MKRPIKPTTAAAAVGDPVLTLTVLETLAQQHRELGKQHQEFGERLAAAALEIGAEMKQLEAEAQACAAELGESRAELAELRTAHETEREKREIAETRLAKLKAKIARFQAECDDLDEEDEAAPVGAAPAETNAEPMAPAMDQIVQSLGLTDADLAAVDDLVLRGEAPDRKAMLRALVRRGLAAGGLSDGAGPPVDCDRGGEPQTLWF